VGIQGYQGIFGIQGLQGLLGNQGLQGLQGPQGFLGSQGFQGSLGNQGNQGITGPTGTSCQIINGANTFVATVCDPNIPNALVVKINGATGATGSGTTGPYNTVDAEALPNLGAGTRNTWDRTKQSLRVGRVNVFPTIWDNNNVGYGSSVIGEDSGASGEYSLATGLQSYAPQRSTQARASGSFTSIGDVQFLEYYLRGQVTSGGSGITILSTDGLLDYPLAPISTSWTFQINVTGRSAIDGLYHSQQIVGGCDCSSAGVLTIAVPTTLYVSTFGVTPSAVVLSATANQFQINCTSGRDVINNIIPSKWYATLTISQVTKAT